MNEIDWRKEFEKETGYFWGSKVIPDEEYYKAYSEWFKQKLNTVIEKIEAEIKPYKPKLEDIDYDGTVDYNNGLKKALSILTGGDK